MTVKQAVNPEPRRGWMGLTGLFLRSHLAEIAMGSHLDWCPGTSLLISRSVFLLVNVLLERFKQLMFTKYLLSARYCVENTKMRYNTSSPCPHGAYRLLEEMAIDQTITK